MRFAGCMYPVYLDTMSRAIQEGCEKIVPMPDGVLLHTNVIIAFFSREAASEEPLAFAPGVRFEHVRH